MPRADYDCLCINLFDGTVRQNRSFALGRLLRDYEAWRHDPPTESEGYRLVVDIYESQERPEKLRSLRSRLSGKFLLDWTADNIANILCWVIVVVQLVLAILASVIQGNQRWDVLLVTGSGTFLSFATCQLPEWRREKFESRKLTKDQDIALTIGQGGRHVVILRSKEGDWDLQALSTAEASLPSLYRLGLGIAFLLWIALLITATSIDERSWYILGIGLLGMIGNAFLAGMKQRPGAWGFRHLVKVKQAPFSERKTMATLKAVEEYKQGFGCSLLPIFFEESSLSSQETQYWEPRMRRWKTNRRPGEPQEQERQGTMTQNIRDPDAATDQDQQWTASRIDQHSTVLIRPPSNHARQSNQSSSASTPNLADPRLPTESNELTRPETIA